MFFRLQDHDTTHGVVSGQPLNCTGVGLFYVQRADGVEMLLAGDLALLTESIEFEQGPIRLASVIGRGDHHANACQLVALNRLGKREASIAIMPGHDAARMQALVAKNVFVPGFLSNSENALVADGADGPASMRRAISRLL